MNLEASYEVFEASSMPYISTQMSHLSFGIRHMVELGKRQGTVRADSETGASDMQDENVEALTGTRPSFLTVFPRASLFIWFCAQTCR